MTLADTKVAEALEQIAARTPSPGGGTAAGLAGACAAALTEMAAAFALARDSERQEPAARLHARAGALRAQLLALADADVGAYQPVLDALALERDDERRTPALRNALSAAAEVPFQIAAASGEIAELAATIIKAPGNDSLSGDANTALTLAEAATGAAAALVECNLKATPNDPRLGEARSLARNAAELRAQQSINQII